MTIYEDRETENKRFIDISMEEGCFRMDLQDLGPEGFEYERSAWNIDVEKLMAVLGVSTQDELFDVVQERFGCVRGFDLFTDLLAENGIHYDYWAG